MDDERLTVPGLVRRRAQDTPELRFVVTDDAALTYGELDELSARLASELLALGASKGSRVGLSMPNGIEWAVTAIAAMRIGCVLVPLSTLLRPPELAAHLRAAGVEHLVCVARFRDRDYVADLAEVGLAPTPAGAGALRSAEFPRLRSIRLWDRWVPDGLAGLGAPDDLVGPLGDAVRPFDDMVVIFTSGSTGAPKAVLHTHGGALGATEAGLAVRCVEPGERLYIPMPFFWMGGFGGGLVTALVAGAMLVTEAEPTPETTVRLLERERVTLFRGWPDQATALAAHPAFADADLSSLKPGSLDGVLPPQLRAAPGARANLFGMTESFGPWCGYPLDTDLPPGKEGSLGRPFPGVELSIVDSEAGGPAPSGGTGQLRLRGPNMMRGICGRDRTDVFTADGWYPTGDLGRRDEDGFVFFAGRVDDMIKVRGATVYPSEVEAALESIPAVRRAFVVDVGGDPVAVGAAVIVGPGVGPDVGALRAEAKRSLSAFKVPDRWAIVEPDDVPRTTTGKVDKDRLRRLIEQRAMP